MNFLKSIDKIALIGIIGVAFSIIIGLYTFSIQAAQKRFEHFISLRERFKGNCIFQDLCKMLENDDEKLMFVLYEDKRDFLGFFEEIAIGMNTKLLKKAVVHYMFGYYAIKCWDSEYFWQIANENMDNNSERIYKESLYWTVFKDFVKQMKKTETAFKFRRKYYKY